MNEFFRPEFGLYWPLTEPPEVYTTMIRRVTDIDVALKYVQTKGICVQAGGFVGMWPQRLIKTFERVYTFEPIPTMYEYLVANTRTIPGIIVHHGALGEELGDVRMSYKTGGGSKVNDTGVFTVPQYTIDNLRLPRCDALFLDIEGSELRALAGAKETIAAWNPVIVAEFGKKTAEKDLLAWAAQNNYVMREKIHSDMILTRSK